MLEHVAPSVQRSTLQMALSGVFGIMAVLQFVLALRFSLFFLTIAAAFGLSSYLVWYHASGRMADRVRRRAVAGEYEQRERRRGGFGAGPRQQRFRSARGPFESARGRSRRRRRGDADAAGRRRGDAVGQRVTEGPAATEAARVLGVSPDAAPDRIKAAYREKVKSVHPDAEGGSEEAFKRVNKAYETLTNDQ